MRLKKNYKKLIVTTLACSLLFSSTVSATTITELKKEQKAAQEELNNVNAELKKIEEARETLTGEIQELDSELVDLVLNLELLQYDIEEKEKEVEIAQVNLAEKEEIEKEQYEAMKLRIQYIYEQGNTDYLALFLAAESFSDFLNQAEYAKEIQATDREMLDEYAKITEEVRILYNELLIEQQDLEMLEEEYEVEKEEIEATLEQKEAEDHDYADKIKEAEKHAQEFKNTIAAQNAEIRKLEEAAAAAAAAAGSNNNSGGGSGSGSGSSGGSVTVTGNSSTGVAIANYALRFVGNPYVYGGTSLTNGADCSGFTQSVFRNFGISLPRTSTAQRSAGQSVSYSEAQAGDLICYSGHVAIYLGNGRIVHASTERTGIITGNAAYRTILSVRRCY